MAGNHGRINPPNESKFYVNWDFLMYNFMAAHTSLNKKIKWNIPMRWWIIKEILGWKFYLDHGNHLGMRYMGIPWYGLEKADGRLMKMMAGIDKKYDYICIGHHHTHFQWDAARGERFCNGSMSSGNFYAAKKMQLTCRPTQLLFGVHPDRGVTFRYPLRLDVD